MIRIILLPVFLLLSITIYAQKEVKRIVDEIPTENLDVKKDANSSKLRSKKKKYEIIYRPNPDKILYGNPCAVEATRKMGFEYMVEPRLIAGSRTQAGKFLNNLKVKSMLVVTRSPLWKFFLKKRFKECRRMSGDFTG